MVSQNQQSQDLIHFLSRVTAFSQKKKKPKKKILTGSSFKYSILSLFFNACFLIVILIAVIALDSQLYPRWTVNCTLDGRLQLDFSEI